MATSILRKVHYQKLHRFYVVLNSQQNASHFLKRDTVSPLCASVRFCSNTPTDKAGSASTKNERQKEEKKTIYLPGTSASYLSPQINQIAEKTGASLKLTDQSTAEKKIPVVITAASPEDIQKAVKEINEVLQAHLAEIRSAQPVQERLEELVFIPRDKAGFLLDEKSSSLLDVQNETATQIKVMSDLQDEQILLVLTGPGQQNITEAMEKIKQLVLQRPKETVKLDHPPFNQFMKLITSMQETGVRIQLDRTQDGDVAKIFAKTREELEDAKAKIQESMDSVRSRAFTFETDTSAWNRFIGKEGANINRIRQRLLEVDPSLSLNTVQNKRKQVTAVYLFGSTDVSEDKFEEAASMVNEEMKAVEKAFGKSKQPKQRLKEMDFEFETENPNAMNVFIGKQGANINLLLEELRKLDSSIAFKRLSNKIVRLLYPDSMDADKLKEAESLVRERMVEIEEYLETRQAPQREKGKKQISFEAANNEVWHMLIGKNESSINAIVEKVKKIDPSLRCELKKPRIFLISDGSVAEDKFEEAASIINEALEGKQKYLDLFVNDVKGKESGKHQIFKPATDRTWRMLIGKEGQHFYRIIQNLEKIDSSLNLQIIRSDISIYNGIILWSKENVDEEKFKKAVSVVKGEIAKIEKSITGNTDREGFKKRTFTFETRGPQAMSHFVGSRGSNIKAVLQELHLLNSNMTIEQKGDSSFQLLYPEDMEENDLEEATHIIEKEVNRIKEFFDIFTTDIKDKQSGKNRIFKFTTDSKEAWNRLIGKEGYYFKKLIRHIKTVNPALDLHIVSPDPSTEQSVILWTKENVDDEQFERAASMIDEVLERVEMSVKGSRPEQPRMSDFKTMTFEFENPRERVIRFFIGANGVNINKVKDELRMINPGFGIRVQKDMTIQFIYPNDADEHHLSLAEALVTKSMNEIEKGTGLSARRRTGNLLMDRDMIGHLVGPDNSNINKLRAKIQKVDPSAEIFADPIRGDVKLYGTEQSFETIESLVYKEVDNIRKSQLIEPVMRDEFEGLDQLLNFNDPMSTTTQSHVEEIKLTERMRDILLDSKTMKLKEIQHLLIKRGKEATIQETQQSLRLHASTKEDLEEISAMIHEAVTNESGKFTKVVKITPGIWMALMEGKGQELQDKYGTRLLTSKLNSADTDNLEIVYENPKQLELVTSEVKGLHNPNVLSHQVFVRSEEYKQLMTHKDEVLRDIQTQAHCFVDIDDVKEKRGGKGGVVTILAKSRLDLDSAVTKINQFVGYSVPNIEQRSKRVPKEKPQKYFLDHQELEYLFSEALDKREITDTQFINIPEDFSFDTMESSNIWTKEDLKKPSRQDTTDNLYYQLLRERKENLLTNRIPYNGYEEMIKLTNEGKMWHYPIDNEQGMDEEKAVSFAEHVFFDDMLEDFPKSGPIRNYMEQVTVGLSQNPHLTVEEKREHVAWYKNYFQGKAETLKDFFGETGELKDFLSKENSKQKKESLSD
ncbi:protein FAM184A [Magallana gigas]|uniref:protein FAM184A n=1 Tax=Magallana gigas TaxID=29159 RepID=UPI003341A67A